MLQGVKMKKIRIILVDDHTVVREGLALILSKQPDIEIVGQADDGVDAVELVKKIKPDVVLLDMQMPRQDGIETIPILKEMNPDIHILILTSHAENERVYKAIQLGAEGYLLKDATLDQLSDGIRAVAAGQASLFPSMALRIIRDIQTPKEIPYTSDPLTPRELDVLRLIAHGLSNQEIAKKIYVQERSVAKHVSGILSKLHLANRTQAALYAVKEGITPPKLDGEVEDQK
jgi:two-component system, NarL family, response regulator LiaR